VAHELVHVRQYHNRGKSLHSFGKAYFLGFLRAGFSYSKNSMEVEAFDFHRCFQERLFSKIAVPELWRTTVLKELTSFAPFTLNGQQHYLAYKKSSGHAEIDRIHADAKGIDTIWSTKTGENWTKGWTAFVPFALGGKPHYLAYKAGSGQVNIDRIRPDGKGVDAIWPTQGTETWSKGWTSFVPFLLGGKPHYVAYKVSNGQVNIDRIRPDGQGVDTVWPAQPGVKWQPGWTSFVPFLLNGKPHHLAYQSSTGKVHIDRIRPGGQGVDTLVETSWSRGWTSMIGFVLNGRPHILSYRKSSGYAKLSSVNDSGTETQSLWCDQWTKGWTAFFPFDLNGKRHHLTYKTGEGTLAIDVVEVVP
jgi:hypothetical protein